jgi:phage-related holin
MIFNAYLMSNKLHIAFKGQSHIYLVRRNGFGPITQQLKLPWLYYKFYITFCNLIDNMVNYTIVTTAQLQCFYLLFSLMS